MRLHIRCFVVLCCLVYTYSICYSEVRQVPSVYPTINAAMLTAQPNDTIMLAQGTYRERVATTMNMTFASHWLFTHDTFDICQTIWIPDTGRVIFSNQCNVAILGLSFSGSGIPVVNRGVIHAIGGIITINECRVAGNFDTARYSGTVAVYADSSQVIVKNSVFDGPDVGSSNAIEVIHGTLTLRKTTFMGRPFGIDIQNVYVWGQLIVDSCEVRNGGAGLCGIDGAIVTNTRFTQCGTLALVLGGNVQVSNCVFEDIELPIWYTLVWTGWDNDTIRFSNCRFQNVMGCTIYNTSFFKGSGVVSFLKCTFLNISNFRNIFIQQNLSVDSCIFHTQNGGIFTGRNPQAYGFFENSDFIRIPNFYFNEDWAPDTLLAPNCYWGDPTGPRHPRLPYGLGTNLPSWVNAIPFRTTPVFPENGIGDPGNVTYSLPNAIELLPAYPNPFNSSVTIRFRLPQPGEATISIYDLTGREVETLHRGYFPAGNQQTIHWQPQALASGKYFICLQSNGSSQTGAIVYNK
ncbi:MAG: T9SS type A sorting domain-containing protein [bacterium]|nr:T9SS type A sorting domain-containing protein [bacterium]